jgi:uncharacterized protein (DUF1697 family)
VIQYLALLRGINVGGKAVIKMKDLKSCFESMGFSDVETLIQSGNILFKSDQRDSTKLTGMMEKALSQRFNYESRVLIITHQQLKKIVSEAPRGFGKEPENFRYDVIFIMEPLSPNEAMKNVSVKQGVDSVFKGGGALYFSRLISRAGQSHLTRIIAHPMYKNITIRNWNTTTKLLTLMETRCPHEKRNG